MMFLEPMLAWAAVGTIAVPIAIHLLMRRRRTPIRWAAMELLQRAVRRRAKRSRLERILLLVARCLLMAAITFAIAGPLLANSGAGALGRTREWIIIIDQSVAAAATAGGGTSGDSILDRSKILALRALDGVAKGERVGVVGMAGTSHAIVWPPSADVSSVSRAIDAVEVSDLGARPRAALVWAGEQWTRGADGGSSGANGGTHPMVVVVSGWTEGTLDPEDDESAAAAARAMETFTARDGQVAFIMSASESAGENRWMQTMQLERHGPTKAQDEVAVRWVTTRAGGPLPTEQTAATLQVAGRSGVRTTTVDFEERQREVATTARIGASAGGSPGTTADIGIRVTLPVDAQPAENAVFSVIALEDTISALIIDRQRFQENSLDETQPAVWVERALNPGVDGGIEVVRRDPNSMETGPAPLEDAVFVLQPDLLGAGAWERLATTVREGGLLVVTPPVGGRSDAWVKLMEQALPGVVTTDAAEVDHFEQPMPLDPTQPASWMLSLLAPELGDLAAPVEVQRATRLARPTGGGSAGTGTANGEDREVLLRMANGQPLLSAVHPAGMRGRVVLSAVPFTVTWSNLPAKPIIVPLLQELVRRAAVARAAGHMLSLGASGVTTVPWEGARRATPLLGRGESGAGDEAWVIESGGRLNRPIDRAGLYDITDAAGGSLGRLAVNVDIRRARCERTEAAALLGAVSGRASLEGVTINTIGDSDATGALASSQAASTMPPDVASDGAHASAPLVMALLLGALVLWVCEGVLARLASHAGTLAREGVRQ